MFNTDWLFLLPFRSTNEDGILAFYDNERKKDIKNRRRNRMINWIICLCFIRFKTSYNTVHKVLFLVVRARFISFINNEMFLLRHFAEVANAEGMKRFLDEEMLYRRENELLAAEAPLLKKRKIEQIDSLVQEVVQEANNNKILIRPCFSM